MGKLNVCFVSYEFPPKVGGEGSYSWGLMQALSKQHKVRVITGCESTSYRSQFLLMDKNSNSNILRVPVNYHFPLALHSFKHSSKKKFTEICEEVDILHLTNDYININFRDRGKIPFVATIHHPYSAEQEVFRMNLGLGIGYWKYLLQRRIHFLRFAREKIARNADHIISVSNYTANELVNECHIPLEKISVIPNAVDVKTFNPSNDGIVIRKKLSLSDELIILYVGRLDDTKGIKSLLEAFSLLYSEVFDLKLILVGDGNLKNYVISYIAKNNLQNSIILAGIVSKSELPLFYSACDLLVLPSFIEGFGIVLLEAMATGKPCVASKAGGTEDVIQDEKSGLLVPPGNSKALYEAMRNILSDRKLASNFGRYGLKLVNKKFTWEAVAISTEKVYEQVIG